MNPTMIQTTLAPLLSVVAGILATYLKFWDADTWQVVLLAALSFGGVVWGATAARKTALIKTTANLPDVHSVKLMANAPNALVHATPNNVTK